MRGCLVVAPEAHLFRISARLPNKLIVGARTSLIQPVLKNRLDRKTEALLTLSQLIKLSHSAVTAQNLHDMKLRVKI